MLFSKVSAKLHKIKDTQKKEVGEKFDSIQYTRFKIQLEFSSVLIHNRNWRRLSHSLMSTRRRSLVLFKIMEEFIIAVCLSLVGTALAERVQVDEKDGKMTFNDAILF